MRMRGYEPQKWHGVYGADLAQTAPTPSSSATPPTHQADDFANRHCNSPSGTVDELRQYAGICSSGPPTAIPPPSQPTYLPPGPSFHAENSFSNSLPNRVSGASADSCGGVSDPSASGSRLATSNAPQRWHNHGKRHILTRDIMRPPKYGGHSKRDQLGSVNESWGDIPGDQLRVGLFQPLPEPTSPSSSPPPQTVNCAPRPSLDKELPRPSLKQELPWPSQDELKEIKAQALERARAGTKMAKQTRH